DNHLLTKVVFPEGNGQLFQYSQGRVTASIQSTSSGLSTTDISTMRSGSHHLVTEYHYQAATNWTLVDKITDPAGNDWLLGRDSLGNVTSYTTPQYPSNAYSLTYDSNSRLVSVTDP